MTDKDFAQLIPKNIAQSTSSTNNIFLRKSNSKLFFTASEKQMIIVCKESPKEYLQPFKDKLEEFFQKGRELHQVCIHETLKYPPFQLTM